ncbi:hypothetical protein G5V58_18385 [Nocardioides anomalus]|uniref:Uncharacterized protein n=1 Tax=Nocardioides anomalus TaxID=2712223 RepID=A0A6G6WGN5_9ACTN|nr:hypothetical protein [Nocardioides anomalus]QIG44488.1 hypothetical protein G5V58_18385 [Nocardioides anomalus]
MSSLLDRIRRPDSNLSDHLFSAALTDAVDEARRIVSGRGAWWAFMLLGGAAVLAATGVGILAAAPTGLAGAALLTSTLAAFGPGGMVGGMVTIAAASSAGSALLGAGVTQAGRGRAQRSAEFAASVAALPVEMMRGALTGWVASIISENKLDMPSSAAQVRALLVSAHTKVVTEENDHTALRSAAAKDWKDRRELIEQVTEWVDKTYPSALIDEAKAALTSSEGRLRLNPAALRELRARNLATKPD